MARFYTYLDLYQELRSSGGDLKDFQYLYNIILSKIPFEISQNDQAKIIEFSRLFTIRLLNKWNKANRCQKTFLNREANQTWLETSIAWPICDSVDLKMIMETSVELIELPDPTQTESVIPSVSTTEAGTSTEAPTRVDFKELCGKQKKRRSDPTVTSTDEEELQYMFTSKLKKNGKLALAKIVDHLSKNADAIQAVTQLLFDKEKRALDKIPEDKSLALYTSLTLSKWQYLTLRSLLQEENCAVLPSYQKLLNVKKRCYPLDESMQVTEKGARVRLQDLLDHTVKRICLDLGPITSSSNEGLKLVWKWGLDGSSSQSNYKQRFSDPEFDDSSVVMISIVPLRLIEGKELIIWENPNPGSTLYCRPVKFTFTSETSDFIRSEESDMQREISELMSTQCGDVEISHELHMTMIDGKVANIVADVPSSATCPICLAKPSEMNNLELLALKPLREDIYKYGISSLHMKIRCMECLLHISYNMDFERWSARGENKILKKAKKHATQQEFREQTGALIDIVKQGFGTTNDGNTARRFFNDYKRTSRITGIDENLILRFAVILQAISSGKKLLINNFRNYCKETAEMFVHLYPWYYMPVSVHKLLMHGAEICNNFSFLPIGFLSEEASEARNKDFRNVRAKNARKTGRIQTNEDILHGLLVSSDPHISRIRPKLSKSGHYELFPEVMQLLQVDSIGNDFEEEEIVVMDAEDVPDPLL